MFSILCLGYLTRNQETALARWEDFDFERMLWRIPAAHTKTGQSLRHSITKIMKRELMAYKRWQRSYGRSQFLFPQKQGYRPISSSSAAHMIAGDSQGQFRLHDLRKYGSSYLRDLGVDYYAVERILNHKKTALDQTYIHTSLQGVLERAFEKWHDVLFQK